MGMTFDGPNKRITLTAGTTSVGVRELWSRWVDWHALSDNSKYLPAFAQVGGNDIDTGAGTKIPVYAFLQNGWRVKPQEANHTINVGDGILLVDGGGDPFVNTTGSYVVRINYQQPVQAISFDSGGGGGGGLTSTQADQLQRIFELHGLDPAKPLVVSPTARTAGDLAQTVAEAAGTTTVTRVP
jgi:hypothetical protein